MRDMYGRQSDELAAWDQWMAGLKVGDDIAVRGRWQANLAKVTKLTPMQVWVGAHGKFWRKSGLQIKNRFGSSVDRPSQELRDAVEIEALLVRLKYFDWKTLDIPRLRRVGAILDEGKTRAGD